MGDFSEQVYEIVARIPYGKVATYGQIAAMMGRPQSGRYVGYAMRNASSDLPAHRVLKAGGVLSPGFAGGNTELQRTMLEEEGVEFTAKGHVCMERYQWMENEEDAAGYPTAPPDDFDWKAELGWD